MCPPLSEKTGPIEFNFQMQEFLTSLPREITGKIFYENFTYNEVLHSRLVSRTFKELADTFNKPLEQKLAHELEKCKSNSESMYDKKVMDTMLFLTKTIYKRKAETNVTKAKECAFKQFPKSSNEEEKISDFFLSCALAEIVKIEITENLEAAKKTAENIGDFVKDAFKSETVLLIFKKIIEKKEIFEIDLFEKDQPPFLKKEGVSLFLNYALEKKDFEQAKEFAFLFKGISMDEINSENEPIAIALAEIVQNQVNNDLNGAMETAEMIRHLEPYSERIEGVWYSKAAFYIFETLVTLHRNDEAAVWMNKINDNSVLVEAGALLLTNLSGA